VIRALLARQLRHHAVLLAVVASALVALEGMIVWFASRLEQAPGFLGMLTQLLPPALRGLAESQLGLLTFPGFVAFGFRHPIALVAAIASVVGVATVPAAERESGFLDLVLSRPVSRARYVAATAATLVVVAVLLPSALLGGAALGLGLVEVPGEQPWWRYAPSAVGMAALLLCFGALGLLLAAGARRRGVAVSQTIGLALAFFFVDAFEPLWAPLGRLAPLGPFHYYDPIGAAVRPPAPVSDVLVLGGVAVLLAAAAAVRFARQDL